MSANDRAFWIPAGEPAVRLEKELDRSDLTTVARLGAARLSQDDLVPLRDVLYELARRGYQIVPLEERGWMDDLFFNARPVEGTPVEVVVQTRCGCERTMLVRWPLPVRIVVPIAHGRPAVAGPSIDFGQREFALHGQAQDIHGQRRSRFLYLEV
jgi:hypothetical protein